MSRKELISAVIAQFALATNLGKQSLVTAATVHPTPIIEPELDGAIAAAEAGLNLLKILKAECLQEAEMKLLVGVPKEKIYENVNPQRLRVDEVEKLIQVLQKHLEGRNG